jgi:4-amino-4-deoxy-L-arabinose transferase-like glycosyltransferase
VSRALLGGLIAVLALAWFGTLGVRPLYKADESRYAEIPREMVASGDWITPRLNGFKYFEKPPLQYWATASFFSTLGERDWVARLWTALTGFAGLALVFFCTKKLINERTALTAAAVLAGSPLYVLLGQVNTLDMGLTFFLSAAVFSFALERWLLFWVACALAVLSKGLIGIVLPLGTVALYVLLKRDGSLARRMKPVQGVALFLLIAAPWFIAVSLRNKEFAHFFFIQEHFERFTTKMHGRYQPAWYFVPVLAVGIAPWLLPLLASVRKVFEKKPGFDAPLFLALWALVVFAFFSVSDSKLPSYILPIFPALAVLIGAWLVTASRPILLAQAALTVIAGIAVAVLAPEAASDYPGYVSWIVAAAGLGTACGIAAFALAWRGASCAAIAALALAGFGCTQVALVGHNTLAPMFSAQSLVASSPRIPEGVPVYAVDAYDHSLPWYLRRTVTMVGYKDELEKAIDWERAKFLPDDAAFARAWKADAAAYAFVPVAQFDRMQKELPMHAVARDPRYILVRKP